MPVSFTQKGYYEVWRDGQKISQHNREREATETITEHSAIHGDGDYEIRPPLVMAKAYGVVSNQDGGDTTPPTTPGSVSASATSATTGTVTWTASTDNVGVAGYQVFVDGSPVDTTTSLSYGLTGLSPSTQYSVTVTAYDAAGNNSPAGGPALFTTDANSAPVWSLGNQAYTTGDAVSINLDSNCTDADGDTITYSLVSGSLPSGLALSGARNQTLSGTVDTAESAAFTLGASDGIAATQTVALTFTITAPDTTAPDAPTGLTVFATSTSTISLDWNDNSESDFSYYEVERSTVGASGPWGRRNPVSPPLTDSIYQDTGLNADTQYWYRVRAVDDSDNRSSPSSVVSGTTDASSGDPYDLYASDTQLRGTIPFTVTWPTEPTITSSATVTPATFSANNVNGREITLSSGTYGDLFIGGSDKTLILQSGANIGTLTLQCQRVKITGQAGSVISKINHNSGGTDVLLDGIISNGGSWELWDPTRMALINSSLTNAGWSFFVQWNPANAKPVDIIVAGNTILASSLSPVRVENVERFILVDNQLRSRDGFASLRIHQEGDSNQDFWVRNNQFENLTDNGRWQFGPNDGQPRTMSNAYFYDNAVYGANSYLAPAPTLSFSNFNAERNYIYSNIETSGDWLVPPASGSGNTAQGGYTTPPTWDGTAVE